MGKNILFAICIAFLLFLSNSYAALAAPSTDCTAVDCVPRLDTVADIRALTAATDGNYPKVYLVSYGASDVT